MITLKVTELEQQNISVKKDSEITFQDKVFKKEKVLSKRDEEKIPEIAEQYSAPNSEILLVEHKLFFSLWVEKIADSTTEAVADQQPVKKIIKKYRGISYEIEVPENAQQNASTTAAPRKYRGKTY